MPRHKVSPRALPVQNAQFDPSEWLPGPPCAKSDSQAGASRDPVPGGSHDSARQLSPHPDAPSVEQPTPIPAGPVVPAESQPHATAKSGPRDTEDQKVKLGRKPASESRAAEIRARLKVWRQTPEAGARLMIFAHARKPRTAT